MVRIRVRMPTAWSQPMMVSPIAVVRRERRELTAVEAVWVAGFGEELSRALGIVGVRLER